MNGVVETRGICMSSELIKKVSEAAKKHGVSFSELVQLATTYAIDNDIDIYQPVNRDREDLENVTRNLRERLIKRFGTVVEAARQLDVTPSTLSRYFAGKYYPSKSVVSKLLKVLD